MESLTKRFEEEVFAPYVDLLKAQYRFHPRFSDAKRIWEEKLSRNELLRGPYLEKAQLYATGEKLEVLGFHERTNAAIRKKLRGRDLYKHQTQALKLLRAGENVVIATGTSSGKTLCYQIPIMDDLVRNSSPGLRAVIVYPLNALVNDQLTEWELMLSGHSSVKFARFTGQTPKDQQEYEGILKRSFEAKLADDRVSTAERDREIGRLLQERLQKDPPNRLNHRVAIRTEKPHVLITNFSMLEYLLVRPIDAPIFEGARLKFLVLDEIHAYRGVQATEIAFLVRRLKDRLGLEKLTCIATSATLGRPDDLTSRKKVREFAKDIFGESFHEDNPVYGTLEDRPPLEPSFRLTPLQYKQAVNALRTGEKAETTQVFGSVASSKSVSELLLHDKNLYELRRSIITRPILLRDAAERLWPSDPDAEAGLQALLEIVGMAKLSDSSFELLPTRLHYFLRAQDGLHLCLHKECPGRNNGSPAILISRQIDNKTPEGLCPACFCEGRRSQLVELVTCRKCGYLFGALQDMGPRRAQQLNEKTEDSSSVQFDSFSTELGWAADSYWSYFSVDSELPYPTQVESDEEDDDSSDLIRNPATLSWCVSCGKKRDEGSGDNCSCSEPHLREIKIFHRQCPHGKRTRDRENLLSQEKKALRYCPNCGARNASGLEPLRRFKESDDETGLAISIPLAHFRIGNDKGRKLLCFADHRQRAAAFPSLLEEETFTRDLGKKIVQIVESQREAIDLISLGELLADYADEESSNYDPLFFLPVSRYPDEDLTPKAERDLWIAETLSYFGVPDSARMSAEDLGLVSVVYKVSDKDAETFHSLLGRDLLSRSSAYAALQSLLAFVRQRNAFTLPKGRVDEYSPAFGRLAANISFALKREDKRILGWIPRIKNDGSYNHNYVTDYLSRLLNLTASDAMSLAQKVWHFMTLRGILAERKKSWKLYHENLSVRKPNTRYVCNRCLIVTPHFSGCCPRRGCAGDLVEQSFDPATANAIARWVSGNTKFAFSSLRSEEHTAQINKELAARIEEDFKAEGINILSSTTTFELGINIGDLQKVLLRNSPPTSASYVQRVGRAGRGSDKNSVCVTLCRRTKYDSDTWGDPSRIMSGEIKPASVFLKNIYIAQRHFNAVAFAKFLRLKIRDEKTVSTESQQIRIEAFLPLSVRTKLPGSWRQVEPLEAYLDFAGWLQSASYESLFLTSAGEIVLGTLSSLEDAKRSALKTYDRVQSEISEELESLIRERESLHKEGKPTTDVDKTIKNLLREDVVAILAKRAFLPRYAFPLDVVTLETGWSRWSRDADVELSRDRGIAIAEFAPGAQVVAHKKVFTSAGLYVVTDRDVPDRIYYSKCPDCEQIRVGETTKQSLCKPCEVCGKQIPSNRVQPFIEPFAFSIKIDKRADGSRYRRHTLIRQRQPTTHFIEYIPPDQFQGVEHCQIALKEDGTLFRYNLGPKNQGFVVCPDCGFSTPAASYEPGKPHQRLRSFTGITNCNRNPWPPLAFGHSSEAIV